jgi:hypothetical protein
MIKVIIADCYYAAIILSVVMLSAIMQDHIILNAVMMKVIMLGDIFNIFMLSHFADCCYSLFNFFKVFMLSVIQSFIIVNVIFVISKCNYNNCHWSECCGAVYLVATKAIYKSGPFSGQKKLSFNDTNAPDKEASYQHRLMLSVTNCSLRLLKSRNSFQFMIHSSSSYSG